MGSLEQAGRLLLVVGGAMVLLGLLFLFAGRLPYVGRLPGDIFLQRGSFTLVFPLATSIIVSLALTIILNVVFRLFR